MRKSHISVLLLPALALGGCAVLRGGDRTPDEFAVARNAPLVIPPDYTLTPPVAGTVGLSAIDAQAQAIEALFGGPAPRSAPETSLLERAGRDRAPIGIRSVAGDPDTRLVDKGAITVAILNAPPADGQLASAQ
ncbi:MAG TPA: DUF3035 domain-containing protein [Sphingomicrobium sp.]|jgi:hypothetical protein|nr:DUF3035 domain-containing protein [Sphingomicrobium sp.]